MSGTMILVATMLSLTAPAFAAGTHEGGHDDHHGAEMAVGMPGDAHNASRTVEISMIETDDGEMLFEPRDLAFAKGETVRLVISNDGEQEHEFVLDTAEQNQEHKALMERFPEMEHDDPNAVRLQPGETGEIVWTFANEGEFEFACLILGHYESGMHGPAVVN
ncbi:cupredoxin family protein [Sulfitobacter sp. LCG007]